MTRAARLLVEVASPSGRSNSGPRRVLLSAWDRTYFFTVRPQDLAGELLRVRVVDPVLDAAECVAVDDRRLTFRVKAHDGVDLIGEGRHERFVVTWNRFNKRVADKTKAALGATA